MLSIIHCNLLAIYHGITHLYSICSLPPRAPHCLTNRLWYSQIHDNMPSVPKFAEGPVKDERVMPALSCVLHSLPAGTQCIGRLQYKS